MDTRNVAMVVSSAVLVAGALVVGMVPETPTGDAASGPDLPPAEAGDQGELLQGEVSRTLEGPAWVDIAYEVHRGMDWDRFAVNVTFVWEDAPDRHDRSQPSTCAYRGPKLEGNPLETQTTSIASCVSFFWDGAIEADVHRGATHVSAKVPNPLWKVDQAPLGGRTWHNGAVFTPEDYRDMIGDANRTTVHLTAFAATSPPDRIVVRADLTGTNATMTTGPARDTFALFREDYTSDLFVRVPSDSFRQENATYEMTLPDDGRATLFMHSPSSGQSLDAEEVGAWYQRPTGERFTCCGLEATYLDGTWRFGYDRAQGRHADIPVLKGLRFEWNEGP